MITKTDFPTPCGWLLVEGAGGGGRRRRHMAESERNVKHGPCHTGAYNRMRGTLAGIVVGLVFFIGASALRAEQQILQLKWNPIKGATGYVVEVKRLPAGEAAAQKITESMVELRLEPGKYDVRVAALNRFGKPAAWSEWRTIDIVVRQTPLVVDLQKKAAEPEPVKEPEPTRKSERAPFWMAVVPGVPQVYEGSWKRGAVYLALFAGAASYGSSERRAALPLRSDPLNNAMLIQYAAFSNYPLADSSNSIRTATLLLLHRQANKDAYETHRKNVNSAAAFIGLLYLVHLWDYGVVMSAERSAFEMSVGFESFAQGPRMNASPKSDERAWLKFTMTW